DLLHRPTISMTAGPAVELKRRSANADTKRIMTALTELLPPEARKKQKPTEEELARTYPKGKGPND
ncbi:MAG: HAD-IB family hydrolase, partial [Acidimicrobiales bacterium]|nr:HAD-IB family hydrolase [Acidimicrobiales bacterium]